MNYQAMAMSAKSVRTTIGTASTDTKNSALLAIRDAVVASRVKILQSNEKDLDAGRNNGLDSALLDRLELNDARIDAMIEGIEQVIALPDPIGELSRMTRRPSGIEVGLMRQPLGVIGIIYEARPNVTVDAAALCLKSGNACVLRGGSEAFHSNQAIAECISIGLASAGLPVACVQVAPTADREFVGAMIGGDHPMCDVIIPRGGKGLIERISKDARVPVIKHLDGNCHVYVDAESDQQEALEILENAKTHRYGVCNAAESFLIHEAVAEALLPALDAVLESHEVEIRGCERVRSIVPSAKAATEDDWFEEYLGPVVAVKKLCHQLMQRSSILTPTARIILMRLCRRITKQFVISCGRLIRHLLSRMRRQDSQMGFEYGLGAEIGISTDRIHARGPVGLEGLTNQKWVVFGEGQVRV